MTEVSAAPLSSKPSALAPLVPVSTLAVIAVSSSVVSASSTASATDETVTSTVAVSVEPPEVTV